jgi:hypothetical protein
LLLLSSVATVQMKNILSHFFYFFLSSFKISSWLSVALFMSVCAGSLSQIIEIHVWSWCNGEM